MGLLKWRQEEVGKTYIYEAEFSRLYLCAEITIYQTNERGYKKPTCPKHQHVIYDSEQKMLDTIASIVIRGDAHDCPEI